MSSTYIVSPKMRVVLPSAKVAAKNPDHVLSFVGEEFIRLGAGDTLAEQIKAGEVLSIKSKPITAEMVNDPEFAYDKAAGTFTIPEGKRGRRPSADPSEDDILAAIMAARASLNGEEAEAVEEADDEAEAEVVEEAATE